LYVVKHIDVQPDQSTLATAARVGDISYTKAMARLTLRLDFGPGQAIGHGKIRLLEAVRDHGSISAAGRSMDMSYRRAWLLIDELNELFEGPVIETKHGGPGGGGAQLTPLGHRVVREYRSIESKAHAAVASDLAGLAAATTRPLPNR
jgi:molybdate transport system regulatory protein